MIEAALARFVADLDAATLPAEIVDAAGLLLLDGSVCMIAGLRSEPARLLRQRIVARAGLGEASLAGAAVKVAAADAALHNGILTHWSEWDDTYDPGAVHGASVILPTLLALAEADSIDDAGRFTGALVAAFEVAARIGRAMWGKAHAGWMPTGIAGAIGAAAGGAKLLGLDAATILSAMGLAASAAGSSRQPIVERVDAKGCQGGLAAQKAVAAIELARVGIAGPTRFLTGTYGLLALMAPGADASGVVDRLGEDWQAARISLKPWPTCRSTHGAIEMALGLRASEGLEPEHIENVCLDLSPVMHALVGAPFVPGDDPRVAAQFSAAYCAALAFVRGAVRIDDLNAERVMANPTVLALADRIRVVSTPPDPANVFAQTMTVTCHRGHRLERGLTDLVGMPSRPLDPGHRQAKLADACAGILRWPERLTQAAMARSPTKIAALLREARA